MAKNVIEPILLWICGQLSAGRTQKLQEKNKMAGDGAFREDREKTVLGR